MSIKKNLLQKYMHCQTHTPKPPIQSKQVFINSGHEEVTDSYSLDQRKVADP